MNLQNALNTATDTARAAGALLRDGFGQQLTIKTKGVVTDWVTQYDMEAETLIIDRLTAVFPDHNIVAEEGGGQSNPNNAYTWYIDPLDGTTNFAHGFPIFCVSIALYTGDMPLVGVIYDPMREECFHAAAGYGAFLTDRQGEKKRLAVSETTELIQSLLATGFPYDKQTSPLNNVKQLGAFVTKAHGIRRNGSAALDLAYVAAGRLDGYWEYKLNPWDIAAGVPLIQEAGGRVTMINGEPFTMHEKPALMVSNGRIHEQMLAVLPQA